MCRTGGRRSKGQGMVGGEELGDGLCPGEGCPGPVKVPITLTYVLYDQGECGCRGEATCAVVWLL